MRAAESGRLFGSIRSVGYQVLTSDGKIRTCLFSHFDHDLYGVMARGGSDEDLAAFIRMTVETKEARHHIGEPGFLKPSRSMVHIGG